MQAGASKAGFNIGDIVVVSKPDLEKKFLKARVTAIHNRGMWQGAEFVRTGHVYAVVMLEGPHTGKEKSYEPQRLHLASEFEKQGCLEDILASTSPRLVAGLCFVTSKLVHARTDV